MAYRIDYGPVNLPKGTGRGSASRLQTMTAVCLLVFILLVSRMWPEGADKLREYLLPGKETVQTAFQEFASELREGASLEASLTAFCRQVIENGRSD